ncbi:MAG: hypothetical protein ACFFC7_03650 [Candidatus Hermodarchaeota archaeon]
MGKTNRLFALFIGGFIFCGIFFVPLPAQGDIIAPIADWLPYGTIPLEEANFQSIGDWMITPAGSAELSGMTEGRNDGVEPETCLIVDTWSSTDVEISREIDWFSEYHQADGAKLTLSCYFARYQNFAEGSVQLGVKWQYWTESTDPYNPGWFLAYPPEIDWSPSFPISELRYDSNGENDPYDWTQIRFIADFNSGEEDNLESVTLVIHVTGCESGDPYNPWERTCVKIDAFEAYITEGQYNPDLDPDPDLTGDLVSSLDFNRTVQSNLQIVRNNIDPDPTPTGIAEFSLSSAISAGDPITITSVSPEPPYTSVVASYWWGIDYIHVYATPSGAQWNDETDPGDLGLATRAGTDFQTIYEYCNEYNKIQDLMMGVVEETGLALIGLSGGEDLTDDFIDALGCFLDVGDEFFQAADVGLAKVDSKSTGTGNNPGSVQFYICNKLGYDGTKLLRDLIVSLDIEFEYVQPTGNNFIDIEITLEIGWVFCQKVNLVTLPIEYDTTEQTFHIRRIGDYDEDGLTNYDEGLEGTDPQNPDTDSDGLLDGEEVHTYSTNPKNSHSDNDGLTDYQEVITYGTNPNHPDTDTDNLNDKVEVITYGTNPNDADSDNDGLTDYQEIITYGTNPNDADTDNDNLNDGAEITYGADPFDTDSDNDGWNDGYEVHTKHTDPTNRDTDGDCLEDPSDPNPTSFNNRMYVSTTNLGSGYGSISVDAYYKGSPPIGIKKIEIKWRFRPSDSWSSSSRSFSSPYQTNEGYSKTIYRGRFGGMLYWQVNVYNSANQIVLTKQGSFWVDGIVY